ncbi:MAG: helix-turn-helix domain-containing protein [Gammaproteobacteria bacterium]
MGVLHNHELRPLSALGIGEWEERVYRWLLAHPRASAAEVARALALSPARAQRLLDTIGAKGLATHTPERPRRYIPVSPDVAVEALALQQHRAVQLAKDMIPDLEAEAAAQHYNEQEHLVELVSSREAERQILEHIQRSTQHELVTLMKAPVRVSNPSLSIEQDDPEQAKAKLRGVSFRSIVDSEYLESPGVVRRIQEDLQAGEKVRVIPHLPLKIVVSDHRIALIPLNPDQPNSPLLIVQSSALLDALYALFEVLWERAVPLLSTEAGLVEGGTTGREDQPAFAQELITLLASGLNDKTIAGELEVSSATLNRRIVAMMKSLGVRTRFQAGWQARGLFASGRPEGKSGRKRTNTARA